MCTIEILHVKAAIAWFIMVLIMCAWHMTLMSRGKQVSRSLEENMWLHRQSRVMQTNFAFLEWASPSIIDAAVSFATWHSPFQLWHSTNSLPDQAVDEMHVNVDHIIISPVSEAVVNSGSWRTPQQARGGTAGGWDGPLARAGSPRASPGRRTDRPWPETSRRTCGREPVTPHPPCAVALPKPAESNWYRCSHQTPSTDLCTKSSHYTPYIYELLTFWSTLKIVKTGAMGTPSMKTHQFKQRLWTRVSQNPDWDKCMESFIYNENKQCTSTEYDGDTS